MSACISWALTGSSCVTFVIWRLSLKYVEELLFESDKNIGHFTLRPKYNFHIFLTVHLGMILVNIELDTQFFMYVYFYFLHVSGSHVPMIRRIIVSMRHLVCVTQYRWNKPGVALIQKFSWWWAHGCPKHVESRKKNIYKKLCFKLVISFLKMAIISSWWGTQ